MTVETPIRSLAPGMLNAFCPLERIATGGQPSPADLAALAEAGYRTVLDTRAPNEPRGFDEVDVVERAGMTYVNMPIGAAPLTDRDFDEFRALMRDGSRQPILVHCASGNRVGLMMLPYLILDAGRSRQDAIELAVQMGLSNPQYARLALDYVERQGA